MLEPTPPTTSGIASGRKSSGNSTSRPRAAAAIAETSEPTAQSPMDASATPASAGPSSGAKNNAKAGSATSSAAPRNASAESVLPSQIVLRSETASTSPSSAPASVSGAQARPRPRSDVKTSATQSKPYAASSPAPPGSAKWKTTSVAT